MLNTLLCLGVQGLYFLTGHAHKNYIRNKKSQLQENQIEEPDYAKGIYL